MRLRHCTKGTKSARTPWTILACGACLLINCGGKSSKTVDNSKSWLATPCAVLPSPTTGRRVRIGAANSCMVAVSNTCVTLPPCRNSNIHPTLWTGIPPHIAVQICLPCGYPCSSGTMTNRVNCFMFTGIVTSSKMIGGEKSSSRLPNLPVRLPTSIMPPKVKSTITSPPGTLWVGQWIALRH